MRPEIDEVTIDAAVRRGLMTHPTEGRIGNFFSELGIVRTDEADLVRAAYFEDMVAGTTVFEGVHDTLAALHARYRLAIVTNGPSDLQRAKLERFDLARRVDFVVISAELGIEKPDPRIFDHVRQLAGVEPQHVAHVGDSLLADVAGANAAGLASIWVRSSLVRARSHDEHLRPHATISRIQELLEE